jgi:DNA-directed RNA polymerase I, II, and III subunit RPABC2
VVGGDDFDDDDGEIDDLNQEEEGDNIELVVPGQTGTSGSVPKNKRITTKYMTK